MTHRVGQKLRVLVIGTLNSALVEFEDGYQCVTSRFGYQRIPKAPSGPSHRLDNSCCSLDEANTAWLKNGQEPANARTAEQITVGLQSIRSASIIRE